MSGATVDPEMGENRDSDTAGVLLCPAGWKSSNCAASEEDTRLADGFGRLPMYSLARKPELELAV